MERLNTEQIPGINSVFQLNAKKNPSEVTLRSSEWAIITQIDGMRSISEIALILSMSDDEVLTLFYGLFEKGLIELKTSEKPVERLVDEKFFESVRSELIRIIGPVAPFLIDDVLWELGLKKNNYPLLRIPEFIEKVSDEIQDESKKLQFQKIMLENMKLLESN